MDQLSGRTIVEPDAPKPLEAADVMDRAIAGTLRNDMNFETASASPMFAVGSIIAKPRDIPPAEAMAVVEDDEVFLEDPEAFDEFSDDPVEAESARWAFETASISTVTNGTRAPSFAQSALTSSPRTVYTAGFQQAAVADVNRFSGQAVQFMSVARFRTN